jgi:hypothetical protein
LRSINFKPTDGYPWALLIMVAEIMTERDDESGSILDLWRDVFGFLDRLSNSPLPGDFLKWLGLQIGHRAGSLALLLIAGGGVMHYLQKNESILLLAGFFAADVALVASFVAWWILSRRGLRSREALGAMIFNFVVLIAAIALMIFSRR